jgi:putative radical SAM enzyme (TIGR03279 family)
MSEITVEATGLKVESVAYRSPAWHAGVLPGDEVVRVEGFPVLDVVDFRFRSSEPSFRMTVVRGGKEVDLVVERGENEDLGMTFVFPLGDGIHRCHNKCIFCFIHQMPKGMRRSLYVMDDDFRLSFLHGNYVTLTNLSREEYERIKEQKLSPLYVSVHSTDPELRGFLLGRGEPDPIWNKLDDLTGAGIDIHAQIVVCPGINDGESFLQTIEDLSALHRRRTGRQAGVLSVAVVPVGLTKHRKNLYPLRAVDFSFATAMLEEIFRLRKKFRACLGTSFVFPADEWFFYAKRPIPGRRFYEDFPQFEDGVGTCRVFLDEAKRALRKPLRRKVKERLTLVTAPLPYSILEGFAREMGERAGIEVDTCVVDNQFFGERITVAGLITGSDLIRVLASVRPRGIVALPEIALREGFLFLDDLTVEDVRRRTGCDVRVCPIQPGRFLHQWLPAQG